MPAKEAKEGSRKKEKTMAGPGEQQPEIDSAEGELREGELKMKARPRTRRPAEEPGEAPAPAEGTPGEEAPQRRRRGGRAHAPARPEEPAAAAEAEERPQEEEAAPPPKAAAEAPAPAAAAPAEAVPAAPAPAGAPVEAVPAMPSPPVPLPEGEGRPAAPAEKPEPPPRVMTFADAVFDVLRGSSEGKPMHFRQITDIALKRRLVRGEPADLWRLLRTAVVRDWRQRDSDGLRARVKYLGQGNYGLGDRKLEPELITAEKELMDRLNRTREATRVALRRRLKAMPASAFELLMRLLLEKLGMVAAELIKRGEGVAYYAGSQTRGCKTLKVLCALRPGDAEVTREAVGELRAGVRIRGFDEGLLLASGRASPAALQELAAGPGIEMYDQEPLTDLLVRHQIGVRRLHLPIEYLDVDLFLELLEPQ
jgi:hypothetical protein